MNNYDPGTGYPHPPEENEVPPEYRKPGRPRRRRRPRPHGPHRARARLVYLRVAELLAIALSFLARSRIARFLTTKTAMNFVVDITSVFGKDAGYRLSTFFALLAAEPYLIVVIVTVVVLVAELIIQLIPRHY